MFKTILASLIFCVASVAISIAGQPWNNPLKIAQSTDGTTFTNVKTFQDSAGVPSVVRWKGDTMLCVFQWFRLPMNSATWDKVAVKISYDAGVTWSDPTLAVISSGSVRIFFSSSDGMPNGGLDGTVNTYSAVSTDGIHFTFEPNPRFDDSLHPVIDPAVIIFNGSWQYCAPDGAPQDGALHATSTDGLHFTKHANYASDNMHNWTGNYMLNSPTELRFYGSGPTIWYNSSLDGFSWQGFTATNITGGDPSVVRIAPTNYLMVYVGQPYVTSVDEARVKNLPDNVRIFPTAFTRRINTTNISGDEHYVMSNAAGEIVWRGMHVEQEDFGALPGGRYFLMIDNHVKLQLIEIDKL